APVSQRHVVGFLIAEQLLVKRRQLAPFAAFLGKIRGIRGRTRRRIVRRTILADAVVFLGALGLSVGLQLSRVQRSVFALRVLGIFLGLRFGGRLRRGGTARALPVGRQLAQDLFDRLRDALLPIHGFLQQFLHGFGGFGAFLRGFRSAGFEQQLVDLLQIFF